jgi:chromosomal replication initiation ATPase DnaA
LTAQFRLLFEDQPNFSRSAFVVSPSNAAAVDAVEAWPAWRGGALALVGPAGSGKSHLAATWAVRAKATVISAAVAPEDLASLEGPVLWEDADLADHDETLFHLINIAARPGGGLLATARTPPSRWRTDVPDLRSRLNALPVALLQQPDDAILAGALLKFFQERRIRPSEELLAYLVRRIERSIPKALEIVAKLDETASAFGRPVSRALARQVLENHSAPEGLEAARDGGDGHRDHGDDRDDGGDA